MSNKLKCGGGGGSMATAEGGVSLKAFTSLQTPESNLMVSFPIKRNGRDPA